MAHCGNNNNSRRCRLTFPIEIWHSSDGEATRRSMHRLHRMARRCRSQTPSPRRRVNVNRIRQVYDHAKQTFPKKSFTCPLDNHILQALVAHSWGHNGFQVRHYGPLRGPRFARGYFAASEATSRLPIVVKWYYEGTALYNQFLGKDGEHPRKPNAV